MKTYQIETKIPHNKLKRLMAGGAVKITPQEHSSGQVPIRMGLNKLRWFNRFNSNIKNGKGVIIKPSHWESAEYSSGEGIWDSIKSVAKEQGKSLAKQALNKGLDMAKNKVNQKISGVGVVAEGEGFNSFLKSVSKGANKIGRLKVVKELGNTIKPITRVAKQKLQQQAINAINNPQMMSSPQTMAVGATTAGTGFFDTLKDVAKTQAKSLAKKALDKGVDMAKAKVNQKLSGGSIVGRPVNNETIQDAKTNIRNGMNLPSQNQIPTNLNNRMAYVRSFKKGGSFRPSA
jgi:hypothetical protein